MDVKNIVDDIFKHRKGLLYKIANMSSTKMDKDEIYHILTCAVLFDPCIQECFEENKNHSYLLALRGYSRLMRDEQLLMPGIADQKRAIALKLKLDIDAENEESIYSNNEDYMIEKIDDVKYLAKAKDAITDSQFEFLRNYYELGGSKCGEIYNISSNACKCKAYKLIKKIRRHILSTECI